MCTCFENSTNENHSMKQILPLIQLWVMQLMLSVLRSSWEYLNPYELPYECSMSIFDETMTKNAKLFQIRYGFWSNHIGITVVSHIWRGRKCTLHSITNWYYFSCQKHQKSSKSKLSDLKENRIQTTRWFFALNKMCDRGKAHEK